MFWALKKIPFQENRHKIQLSLYLHYFLFSSTPQNSTYAYFYGKSKACVIGSYSFSFSTFVVSSCNRTRNSTKVKWEWTSLSRTKEKVTFSSWEIRISRADSKCKYLFFLSNFIFIFLKFWKPEFLWIISTFINKY